MYIYPLFLEAYNNNYTTLIMTKSYWHYTFIGVKVYTPVSKKNDDAYYSLF